MNSILLFKEQPKKTSEENKANAEVVIAQKETSNISKTDLVNDWIEDGIIKNGINILTRLVTLGIKIESDDTSVQEDINIIDNNIPTRDFIENMVRDSYILGTAFNKYLYMKGGNKIVGLWNEDSIRMDFQRDNSGYIILNGDGTPKGFYEEIPYGIGENIKQTTSITGKKGREYENDGENKEISYFVFEKMPGSIEGVSRIRAAHKIIRNKWKIEDGIAQATNDFAVPIWLMTIGNKDKQMVLPDTMKKAIEKMQSAHRKQIIILPWWEELKILYPQGVGDLYQNLEPFLKQLPPALGIPLTLLFRTGEDSSRGTLKQEIRLFIPEIEADRDKLVSFLTREIFGTIAKKNGWKTMPKISFKQITLEDIESFATRMTNYVSAGIIDLPTATKIVAKTENFSEDII
jgi:hypothetical protein